MTSPGTARTGSDIDILIPSEAASTWSAPSRSSAGLGYVVADMLPKTDTLPLLHHRLQDVQGGAAAARASLASALV